MQHTLLAEPHYCIHFVCVQESVRLTVVLNMWCCRTYLAFMALQLLLASQTPTWHDNGPVSSSLQANAPVSHANAKHNVVPHHMSLPVVVFVSFRSAQPPVTKGMT